MINKITMEKVASYKNKVSLLTDKRINLIYGLNGTGKSTLSNFFYFPSDPLFNNCVIESLGENDELLVYNQKFIEDNFYVDSLKGIFTLSKENKGSKEKIEKANENIKKLDELKKELIQANFMSNENCNSLKNTYVKKVWEIKKKYDGINSLSYCFEGVKKDMNTFFDFFINLDVNKEDCCKTKSLDKLINDIESLNNNNEEFKKYELYPDSVFDIENSGIFGDVITGNDSSYISKIINEMNSSDWVKKGLEFINLEDKEEQLCPFCQNKTINKSFINAIKMFFDQSYENEMKKLQSYRKNYVAYFDNFKRLVFDDKIIDSKIINSYNLLFDKYKKIMSDNINIIDKKINVPSKILKLNITQDILNEINGIILNMNEIVENVNITIRNKKSVLLSFKESFWLKLRKEYKVLIDEYLSSKAKFDKEILSLKNQTEEIINDISVQKKIIIEEQKNTINIDYAIEEINIMLLEIGISDFYITKADENMYKIVRNQLDNNIFKTLSEGEKMLISFLYFIKMCEGSISTTKVVENKFIMIDDPINSMSHIYVFNISRLIKNRFFDNKTYNQIFVLTHSLYFFYELAYLKKEDREKEQKLIRIVKNLDGSYFDEIHYNEIQNDYQAYWAIIKDQNQHPALIANCMRNIIEYFFGFVEKRDLNNTFQLPELKQNRFEAFNRYINRESHSIGQNIFDVKEFNYNDFLDAFKLVFKLTNYEEHYIKMMR